MQSKHEMGTHLALFMVTLMLLVIIVFPSWAILVVWVGSSMQGWDESGKSMNVGSKHLSIWLIHVTGNS